MKISPSRTVLRGNLTESDGEDVLSTTLKKAKRSELSEEQRLERQRLRVNERSSAAAEKSGEGMAFKIFTGAKPFLKAYIKPFDITVIRMLPLCCVCFFFYLIDKMEDNITI